MELVIVICVGSFTRLKRKNLDGFILRIIKSILFICVKIISRSVSGLLLS